MNRSLLFTLATLATTAACHRESAPARDDATAPSVVERGKLLVTTSGCHDCHTPLKLGPSGPEPDFDRQLSGHPESLVMPPAPAPQGPWLVSVAATNTAWAGPWGVSFTRNLTPDDETGIGTWSEETFIDTIRNGRHMGVGRNLLPPMPWKMYSHLSDADLKAIYAYLRSIPAIKNHVPDPIAPAQASL